MDEVCAYAQLQQILGFARLSHFEVAVRQENLSKYDSVTFRHSMPTVKRRCKFSKNLLKNCKKVKKKQKRTRILTQISPKRGWYFVFCLPKLA